LSTTLDLQVRYYQDSTPAGIPCREESFERREIDMALPVEQTAFVLVDMWNLHFCESWLERAKRVTAEAVVPALAAARSLGLTIIHAPCPEVAKQYPQLARHKPPPDPPTPSWPPAEFRRREGEYVAFRGPRDQPPGIRSHWAPLARKLAMSPAITVLGDDEVIATGQQLHELLEARHILHLIYCGFATNWCIMHRDYGVRAMSHRGYNVILLRDATTGVEYPDTLQTLFVTEVAIREIENQVGFSASTAGFIAACAGVRRDA